MDDTKKLTKKIMVDFILYNSLGDKPTEEEIKILLSEYELEVRNLEDRIEQNRLVLARLKGALLGKQLYTESYEKFREEVGRILHP